MKFNCALQIIVTQSLRWRGHTDNLARCVVATAIILAITNGICGHEVYAADSRAASEQRDPGYKLGPLDKVNIKIFEWRPSRDEVYNWLSLNGEYTVGANGMMAFPLLGEVEAGGSTSAKLARTISRRLQVRMGLAVGPNTTIEVSQYRPFYVVGEVERPGAYPYRPGLTALQAISIAGGFIKKKQFNVFRLEREMIASQGKLRLLERDITVHTIRKARLDAELNDAAQIDFQAVISSSAKELLEQEKLIFDARQQAYRTQVKALNQLKDFLAKEIISITAQVKTIMKRQSS